MPWSSIKFRIVCDILVGYWNSNAHKPGKHLGLAGSWERSTPGALRPGARLPLGDGRGRGWDFMSYYPGLPEFLVRVGNRMRSTRRRSTPTYRRSLRSCWQGVSD